MITPGDARSVLIRDSRNAPLWLVGVSAGAIMRGIIAYSTGEKVLGENQSLSNNEKKLLAGITGTGAGVVMGSMIGYMANYIKENLIEWPRKPWWDKILALFPFLLGTLVMFMNKRNMGRK